jgi:NAD(P)-dependent dehydrogenase (short-subunit alcohol dehydrogenase family)
MKRTYVVTGSASGIGEATRTRLQESGQRVIGVDRHHADVVGDVGTRDGRRRVVGEVTELVGSEPVDAVITCAGVSSDDATMVRVNFFGAVELLDALRPLVTPSVRGRAVVVASMAVIHPCDDAIVDACLSGDEEAAVAAAMGKGALVYRSTKRALARWVRRTAPTKLWAGAGIPLNAVAPGVIKTPMTAELLNDPSQRERLESDTPMPLGGYGTPEQVASLVEWLASADNSMVTGQCIFIDGGSDVVLRGDDIW